MKLNYVEIAENAGVKFVEYSDGWKLIDVGETEESSDFWRADTKEELAKLWCRCNNKAKPNNKIAYVVGYSGGFDWFFTPEAQEKDYNRTVKATESLDDYHVIKFTYDYDENMTNDEVTEFIDYYFNSDQFGKDYPEWHILGLQDYIEELKEENLDLRMKAKEYRKLLEYNNIEVPEINLIDKTT
jgi:hypothetical protein